MTARNINGVEVGGVFDMTIVLPDVDFSSVGAESGIGAFSIPAGYKGRVLAVGISSVGGINDAVSLAIRDVNDEDYISQFPITAVAVNANSMLWANPADLEGQLEQPNRGIEGAEVDNADMIVYAQAPGVGSGTGSVHIVVRCTPGTVNIIPDSGGG